MRFCLLNNLNNLVNYIFTFANNKSVNESPHRFGVIRGLSAGNDQRIGLISLSSEDGNASQV